MNVKTSFNRLNSMQFYTTSEAAKAMNVSYRTFKKYFENVRPFKVKGRIKYYLGEDLNNEMINLERMNGTLKG